MNALGLLFTVVAVLLLVGLPRRFAAVPLLMAALYMTRGQALELGAAHLTVIRVLAIVGFVRVMARAEHPAGGLNGVDRFMLAWSFVLIATSAFHTSDAWVFRAGIVTDLGCYFLFRCFLVDADDVIEAFKATCLLLGPLAIVMLYEKATGHNVFGALFGGVNETALVREGHVRASGPFAHPILAGTAGATGFAFAMFLWNRHRLYALCGLAASGAIVFASTSSGPIMMIVFMLLGFSLWALRGQLRMVRWLAVGGVLALAGVMNDPVYFLVARIDISGGSQGYFRAQLIRSSIEHLDEWWLAGTDFTRHWMASGVYANERHTDITNHLLAMGVMGGLLLMLVFIAVLVAAFRGVGRALDRSSTDAPETAFLAWTLGVVLFGHVMNFMSISLFDQSILFFYVVLAGIGAVASERGAARAPATVPSTAPRLPREATIDVRGFAVRTNARTGKIFGRADAA